MRMHMTGMLRAMLGATALVTVFALPARALEVVVSIKPLHSLVAGVMGDTGSPRVIVGGNASPHTYVMRPSDAAALENAELVFWIGHDMETYLERPLAALAGGARVVEIAGQRAITLLEQREGGPFEAHSHGDHGHEHADHEDDDDHAHGEDHDHEDHEHEDHAADDHQHGTGPGQHTHGPEEFDMHLWLDPQNAAAVVGVIEAALADADPANADTYKANAETLRGKLEALSGEIDAELARVKGKPFIVFHDAYQYFEDRFGMPAAGSITVNPDVMPGAARLTEIRAKIAQTGAACVFAEPQFEPRLVETLIEGTNARAGVLDPEGGLIEEGPELYFTLMRGIARNLRSCLAGEG